MIDRRTTTALTGANRDPAAAAAVTGRMATRRVEYHTLQVARESFFLDTRYTNLKPVGDGSYGFVCAADDALTGRRVAIKKVGDTFCDLVDAKRILREIKLLRVRACLRACLRACDAWRRLEGWVWDLIDLVALILTPPPINTPPPSDSTSSGTRTSSRSTTC